MVHLCNTISNGIMGSEVLLHQSERAGNIQLRYSSNGLMAMQSTKRLELECNTRMEVYVCCLIHMCDMFNQWVTHVSSAFAT